MASETRPWLSRLGSWLWQHAVRSWFRKVDFVIVCRDLHRADFALPKESRRKLADPTDFVIPVTEADFLQLQEMFPPKKVKHFRWAQRHPDIEFLIQHEDDKVVRGFVMHGMRAMKDREYGFVVPLQERRDVLIFDGWVDPNARGRMIALVGANWYHQLRRNDGFDRAYAVLRVSDFRSRRLHERMAYKEVGEIHHLQVGPLKFNRIEFEHGQHPAELAARPQLRPVLPPPASGPEEGEVQPRSGSGASG